MIKSIDKKYLLISMGLLVAIIVAVMAYMFTGIERGENLPRKVSKRVKIEPFNLSEPQVPLVVKEEKSLRKSEEASEKDVIKIEKKEEKPKLAEITKPADIIPPGKLIEETRKAKKPAKSRKINYPSVEWAINVTSTSTRQDALEIANLLKRNGYNSYVTRFEGKGGKTWYRVRVGFFNTREEANKSAQRISKKFSLRDSWVVKPSSSERKKFSKR